MPQIKRRYVILNVCNMPVKKNIYRKSIYNRNKFESINKNQLDSNFITDFTSQKRGRKSLDFDECSRSDKWRKSNSLRDNYSDSEIQHAFLTGLRNNGKSALANIIYKLLHSESETNTTDEESIAQLTDYEALTFFV